MAVDKRSARLGVLATVSLILIGLLGARLWFLQGVQSEVYQARVTASKTAVVYTPPERGRIFDADGRVLADNKRILTVTVDWAVVKKQRNRQELFERLSGPLETPIDDLMRRYDPCYLVPDPCKQGQLYDRLLPLPLKEDVDEDTVAFIKERSEDYPGVDVMVQYKRVYLYAPHGVPAGRAGGRAVRCRAQPGARTPRALGQARVRSRCLGQHRARAHRPASRASSGF